MSVHLSNVVSQGLPPEPELLQGVQVRLIKESERPRFDDLLRRRHYLKTPPPWAGPCAMWPSFQGRWLAPAGLFARLHLKPGTAGCIGRPAVAASAICWPKTSASWSWPPPGLANLASRAC
ncbi:MAG: hypothetical protein H7A47_09200 [Verrucomicrobiales bacterium]|nr:hypothetical protein [Verrucomicrobiales bacterium]